MFFRNSSDRRRRVLADGMLPSAAPQRTASKSKSNSDDHPYTDAALPENQPHLTDFIPTRKLTLALLSAGGLLVIGCLLGLPRWLPQSTDAAALRLTTFDPMSPRSLANWFSTMALATAGLGAWIIYLVRRHRLDDYRGRYRLWLWTAAFWFFLSADEISGLHDAYRALAGHLLGWTPDETVRIWLGTWAVLLGILVVRMLFEMRACLPAIAAMMAMVIGWSITAVVRMGWRVDIGIEPMTLAATAKMLGHWSLLLMTALYARHVILDAQGLRPKRKPKPKAEPATKSAAKESAAKEVAVSASRSEQSAAASTVQPKRSFFGSSTATASTARPVESPRPTSQAASATSSAATSSDDDDSDDDDSGDRRLSKAERKRLRRQQRSASRTNEW